MAEKTVCILQLQTKPIKIIKWKVHEGISIPVGRLLLLYDFVENSKNEYRKLKSSKAGMVHKIVAQEGDTVNTGELLLELQACGHPTIMNDMCAECGADLRNDDATSTASVPMIHAIPDLKVSEEVALKLGRADNERLIKARKLVLLVDLDQTLIHTTNDNIPPNIRDIYHFQLYGPQSPWYHTRLRPGTHNFLRTIHSFYELHICTFGARNYAHMIANFLDADQNIFSNRILSRDECFDPTSKKANLKALFPCGDNMVCIIDDREDVWSHASNLIHVKPYHFFRHTGDINAPPGLDKHDQDVEAGAGVDLTVLPIDNKSNKVEENGKKNEIVDSSKDTAKKAEKEKVKVNGTQVDQDLKSQIVQTVKDDNDSEETCTKTCSDQASESKNESENKPSTNNVESMEESVQQNNKNSKILYDATQNNILSDNQKSAKPDDCLIDVEDPDDYLIYLEEILKRIHKNFYDEFDKMESGNVPDLKRVIPMARSQVLKGCHLVFSGLVPTHVKLEQSKAFQVARNLGAKVTQDLDDKTTHLVAVKPGTAKVNAGRRRKQLKIVTPDWLWCCAERWEHADERIFPLSAKGSKNRHPPAHCGSPEHPTNGEQQVAGTRRKRTPSGRFMDTINPLMSFSSADIADMDKEVEDILINESDSSSSEDEVTKDKRNSGVNSDVKWKSPPPAAEVFSVSDASSSSEDSLTGEFPKGYKRKRAEDLSLLDDYYKDSTEDESPSIKFRDKDIADVKRDVEGVIGPQTSECISSSGLWDFGYNTEWRGEDIDDIVDMEQDETQDSNSLEPPDEVDDGEWNMMGAALEREFLSNN